MRKNHGGGPAAFCDRRRLTLLRRLDAADKVAFASEAELFSLRDPRDYNGCCSPKELGRKAERCVDAYGKWPAACKLAEQAELPSIVVHTQRLFASADLC